MDINKIIEKIYKQTGNYFDKTREEILRKKILNFIGKYRIVSIEEIFDDPEIESLFIDSIVVNETYFFRHKDQLNEFKELYLRGIYTKNIKILSAGCSTGKEAYTLGMLCFDVDKDTCGKVVYGIDISKKAISVAKRGVYSLDDLKHIPVRYRSLLEVKENKLIIGEKLRSVTSFSEGNILDRSSIPQSYFDVIFCRNVLIYFDRETVKYALYNFHRGLKKDGILVLSPIEKLPLDGLPYFRAERKGRFTFYRKMG
ncbi:chemotaxis protein methyltransferase CheR [Persephonella hydrogeniphila]|uniref:Chemotaxis protein methyltransferase CheR n=1 Tax=Persephonella hydrogeniphila TaxID=198703 RepID=A0A285NFV5_9AQUI|nr:CheR family methyltransferase [Persephonella hydrogeniphila]SNZ08158.1 chemotaxis protein methyltransferase CheR [Persephonella hydrogeniphila]